MSKRFKWRVIGPDTVVIFHGAWGIAHKNDSDDFDTRHGIYLALLRAMRSKMLKRPGDREGGAVDEAIESLAYDGRVKDWQRLTASFISFVSERRGKHNATAAEQRATYEIANGVSITFEGRPRKFNASLAEDEFVRLHRAELDELVDVGHILTGYLQDGIYAGSISFTSDIEVDAISRSVERK